MPILPAILLAALTAGPQETPPSPTPPAPCAGLIHRQFDFWVGQWDVVDAAGGELQVVDSVKRPDGSWGEFGRSKLKRQ